jgi:hypothetical protein
VVITYLEVTFCAHVNISYKRHGGHLHSILPSNMASNYWESTQRKFWTFTKQQLAFERKKIEESERNLVNMYPLPDRRHLSIYFYHRMSFIHHSVHNANRSRTHQNGKTFGHPATSARYSSGLCATLLRKD